MENENEYCFNINEFDFLDVIPINKNLKINRLELYAIIKLSILLFVEQFIYKK